MVVVGNTVMHHLFCGISLEPLSHFPFEPVSPGLQVFEAGGLGWELPGDPAVRFLPCLGSFVGSDILAGLLATKLHESEALAALIDLGTNGEIVVGNRERMLCASTAAGPAFEGARISMGMRAATGAISEVRAEDGKLRCHVLGNAEPRGICGSGLVDAVAAGLDLGWITAERPAGAGGVARAGGAGVAQPMGRARIAVGQGGDRGGFADFAGANGARRRRTWRRSIWRGRSAITSIRPAPGGSGCWIFRRRRCKPAGNTALLGAKLALFSLRQHAGAYPEILGKVRHVSLNEDERFQDRFVAEMGFPEAGQGEEGRGAARPQPMG